MQAGPGFVVGDADLAGDGGCGGLVVAGQHHDAQALSAEIANCLNGLGLDGIGDAEDSRGAAIDCGEDDGLAFLA